MAKEAAKLVQQNKSHKQARRNAKANYRARIETLKISVGSLAVTHGLVVLTEDELEGLFFEAATALKDSARVAAWSRLGEAARKKREADRVAKRKPKRDFRFGRSTKQSEELEKALRAAGFRLSTDSAPYWKLSALSLPDTVMGLAKKHGEKLWSYDDEGDKVMIFAPPTKKPAALQGQFGRKPGLGAASAKPSAPPQSDTYPAAGEAGETPPPAKNI